MQVDNNTCTGCGACAISCPLNCITMQADQEGFRYPVIDMSRCISCRKCEAVCPVFRKLSVKMEPRAYGVKHRDAHIRSSSSSGGAFSALATFVLAKGGVVCAAAYADDFSVEHQVVEDITEISKLQGAKYAQSRTEHLFPEIRRILDAGRWVLYVGTPCQTAGLKAYLGKAFSGLILVDIICHGVPSPLVWKNYVDYRVKKDANTSKVVAINQRDKISGWSKYRYSLRINYKNGKSYCKLQSEDAYMLGFVNNLFLRPSCSNCSFKGFERCSDITLGDFWGVWEQYPEFDDDNGTSLILINTEKGACLWDKIKDCFDMISVDVRNSLRYNPSAYMSATPHPKRDEFFDRLKMDDFEKLISELLFDVSGKRYSIRKMVRRFLGHK